MGFGWRCIFYFTCMIAAGLLEAKYLLVSVQEESLEEEVPKKGLGKLCSILRYTLHLTICVRSRYYELMRMLYFVLGGEYRNMGYRTSEMLPPPGGWPALTGKQRQRQRK